ncbi:MAG: four helix bundle protein [Anaerolineae bacterium]|nr:four helix bundle protein [Anaerolineae bacterium]MCI0608016.1 four helix bundle protein [Anaerolineae bacterium]
MHNCAEGFDAGFDNEFVVFLKYARRSASEIQSEIYLALDRNYVDKTVFKQIHDKATETKKIIYALIAYLRRSKPPKSLLDYTTTRLNDQETIMLSYHELRSTFEALNLADKPVIGHAAFRRFGDVEGGAPTVLHALLDSSSGLIMPTFTYNTMVTPEVGPPNNGITYGSDRDNNKRAEPFQITMPPDKMIGILPWILLQQESSIRTAHPILSFGGFGMDSALATQTLYEPLAPIGALAEQNGWIVLINVDHSVNTSIHYAEKLAGRRQFVRWALVGDRVVECPGYPGDSSGFQAIEEYIKPDTSRVEIGDAFIEALPLKRLFDAVQEIIKKDPLALLCERLDCERCNAIKSF